MALASLIVVMNKGRIEDAGPPQRVYARPATRFAARFMGESTQITGRAREGGVETAFGLLPVATVVPSGEAVTLVLRPENLRADGSGGISLGEARITDTVFQGAHQRVLAAGATGEQHFLLRLPPAAVTAPGTKLSLSCQAEDLIAVREASAPAL